MSKLTADSIAGLLIQMRYQAVEQSLLPKGGRAYSKGPDFEKFLVDFGEISGVAGSETASCVHFHQN